MLNPARLREAELALINAPFDEGGWTNALERTAWACGGTAANIVGLGGPLMLPLNQFTGKFADAATGHFANPVLWGACNWRVGSSAQPMTIQHDGHYRAYRRQHGFALTAQYDDVVADIDMQFGCQAVLVADQEHFLGLAVMRGRMEGRCDSSAIFAFERLIRHAQRSVRVHLALDGEAGELLVGDWQDKQSPMMVLDRFGGLCAMTNAAEDLLDDAGPLSLRGLSVAARNRQENRNLQTALARLLQADDALIGPRIHQMAIGRNSQCPAGNWKLTLMRLPRLPHGLGFDPHLLLCAKRLDTASGQASKGR